MVDKLFGAVNVLNQWWALNRIEFKSCLSSRIEPVVENPLWLNTEQCHLDIVETEFESICCLLKQRCRLQTDRMNDRPTEYYNPLRMRWGLTRWHVISPIAVSLTAASSTVKAASLVNWSSLNSRHTDTVPASSSTEYSAEEKLTLNSKGTNSKNYKPSMVGSGIGQGGQGGATAPPLLKVGGAVPPAFWTCLHLKWKKRFLTSVCQPQILSSSIKIFASDCTRSLSEHENTQKISWGHAPRPP